MHTFRNKLLICFALCLVVPLAVTFVGQTYYDADGRRKELTAELQQLQSDFSSLRAHQTIFLSAAGNSRDFHQGKVIPSLEVSASLAKDLLNRLLELKSQLPEQLRDTTQALHAGLIQKNKLFSDVSDAVRIRGFQDYGAVGEMRVSAHALEQKVTDPNLLVHVLMMRRHEKDYIIRNQLKYVDQFNVRAEALLNDLQAYDIQLDIDQIQELINSYTRSFHNVVALDNEIGIRDQTGMMGALLASQTNIQHNLETLLAEYQQYKTSQLDNLATLLTTMSWGLFALVICTLLVMARSMTSPIRSLSEKMNVFLQSNFSSKQDLNDFASRKDEVGQISRSFAILQDQITEHISELEQARATADQHNRAKSLFLANMSHEIRTPLNGVVGMSQFLAGENLDEQQRECVDVIESCSRSLLGIVNDVLDFSKIEARSLVLEDTTFEPQQCVANVVSALQSNASTQGINLALETTNFNSRQVTGDPTRWTQVVRNLVNNAVKFTPEGSVTVTLSNKLKHGVNWVSVQVTDTGLGIPPDALEKIFDAFVQQDESTTRKHGGTGLGLSISLQLAKLMSGSLYATSEVGVGSCFTFTAPLPVAVVPAVNNEVTEDLADALHVLLVEDNAVNQKVALRMLEKLGCTAQLAENGAVALNTLGEEEFDVVLMDVQMPVMDGLEATRQIRTSERFDELPVVALTANATTDDQIICRKVGMQEILTKPVSFAALKRTLVACANGSLTPMTRKANGG